MQEKIHRVEKNFTVCAKNFHRVEKFFHHVEKFFHRVEKNSFHCVRNYIFYCAEICSSSRKKFITQKIFSILLLKNYRVKKKIVILYKNYFSSCSKNISFHIEKKINLLVEKNSIFAKFYIMLKERFHKIFCQQDWIGVARYTLLTNGQKFPQESSIKSP